MFVDIDPYILFFKDDNHIYYSDWINKRMSKNLYISLCLESTAKKKKKKNLYRFLVEVKTEMPIS